jgi:non-specific serine/threonine protein kinase/serine/threonine-protein kinase
VVRKKSDIGVSELKDLFWRAATLDRNDRTRFLDGACLSGAVRTRIQRMLEAYDSGDDWLGTLSDLIGDEQPEDRLDGVEVPERIGRYDIVRRIAVGGMGVVYEGLQHTPRRPVAIKVLPHHLNRRTAGRRFKGEVEILGLLRHPAIAQIYDADIEGEGAQGTPYFAMEFVTEARTIIDYRREHDLSVEACVEMFILVCDGVQHGHQKGVIHRDLKPDNILVDGSGNPKIIDFGVSRVMDVDVVRKTTMDGAGIVGTLQYMSPEQLELDTRDIDTRADVYSLGAVLYELLAGAPVHDLQDKPVGEALRVMREDAPARLSSRARGLPRDVERIVYKALDRDRNRRYQSAAELGADIRRFLRNEPVEAHPPSPWYRTRKALRRHWFAAAALLTLALLIVTSAVGMSVLLIRVENARVETAAERDHAVASLAFLESMLTAIKTRTPDDLIAYRQILDAASGMIEDGLLDGDPLTEASVRAIIARAYMSQRLYADALAHMKAAALLYERELGFEARETIEAYIEVTRYGYQGGRDTGLDTQELARRILETSRRVFEPDDRLILRAVEHSAFARQSTEGWQDQLDARIAFDGPESSSAHFTRHVLGRSLADDGRAKEGRPLQERALAFFITQPNQRDGLDSGEFATRQFLSGTYRILGLFEKAEEVLTPLHPLLDEYRRGERPLWVYPAQTYLFQAEAIAPQGRLYEAERLLRADLAQAYETLGGNWVTSGLARVFADVLREQGQLVEALEIVFDKEYFAGLSADDPSFAACRASALLDAGEPERAEVEALAALANLDGAPTDVDGSRLVVGAVLLERGRLGEAREQIELAMRYYDEACEPVHPGRARVRCLAGDLLAAEGETDGAEAILREALTIDLAHRGPDSRETAKSRLALGRFLALIGRMDEARVELAEAERILRSSPFDEGLWLPRVIAAKQDLDR